MSTTPNGPTLARVSGNGEARTAEPGPQEAVNWRWAALLWLALALHAWSLAADSGRAGLWHLLWSCHVATFLLGVGLAARSRLLVQAGFLFHLGIGLPAWLVQVIVTHGTFGGAALVPHLLASSILVHILPLAAGYVALGRARFARSAWFMAMGIQVILVPVAHWLTPADLNVNLAHQPWPPMQHAIPSLWGFQALESAVCGASLLMVWAIWNRWMARGA